MTFIIPEQPVSACIDLDPVELMQSQAQPAYCGICACPCLQPRLPTPQPDAPDSPATKFVSSLPTPSWLHQYHHIQPCRGLLPFPFDPSTQPDHERTNPSRRIVAVHLFCYRMVAKLLEYGIYGMHYHQEMMMYSVPRYIGFGPWNDVSMLRTETPEMSWMGLNDQKARWKFGIEGSHLTPADLHDPTVLDDPLGYSVLPTSPHRKLQRATSPPQAFTNLPTSIITSIAQLVLCSGDNQPATTEDRLDDLLALSRTSHSLRDIDLPEASWAELTMQAVDRFRNDLMKSWRANSGRTGGAGQVVAALDCTFADPVEKGLQRAKEANEAKFRLSVLALGSDGYEEDVDGLTARDVLYWWLYSDVWRSRRRVCRCAVLGSVAARKADWW